MQRVYIPIESHYILLVVFQKYALQQQYTSTGDLQMHETMILIKNSFKLFKYIIRMLCCAILIMIGCIDAAYDLN